MYRYQFVVFFLMNVYDTFLTKELDALAQQIWLGRSLAT